jgi:glycosyltransferase involved in cell wall biosynthesis
MVAGWLRKQGHTVEIINTPHTSEMIARIQQLRPDVVHIQFDNYGCIIPHIVNHCKLVAITSHSAYLEQREKWNSYIDVWNGMIQHKQPNVYHFVLSEGIANVYRQHGVDPTKIIVTPNGADPTLFAYTEQPRHTDRSIVVAKVERRKGQYLLQHNPDVWFAGNRGDDTFDYSSPRWVGEWNKETLYQELTHYGNLVLLSEGEADPLVVKEAFVAGLGVVVSQWDTANLDISQPFITVIPNDRMHDREYVDLAIRMNRAISVRMRSEIREYSRCFHWSTLVRNYVQTIRNRIS